MRAYRYIARPLYFHLAVATDIRTYLHKEKFSMGAYTSDNALREKWSGRKRAEDYQWKILIGKMLTN